MKGRLLKVFFIFLFVWFVFQIRIDRCLDSGGSYDFFGIVCRYEENPAAR